MFYNRVATVLADDLQGIFFVVFTLNNHHFAHGTLANLSTSEVDLSINLDVII